MGRLFAVGIIWLGCAVAWAVLGTTIVARTDGIGSSVRSEVHSLWGPPATQNVPIARYSTFVVAPESTQTSPVERTHDLEPSSSDIDVSIDLEHRRRGLLWFPTYTVSFDARYGFTNGTGEARDLTFVFPLTSREAGYDGFAIEDAAGNPVSYEIDPRGAHFDRTLADGERIDLRVRYRTRGTASWTYVPSESSQVRTFALRMDTSFDDVDFPPGSISPSRHSASGDRWHGEWRFESLISAAPIAMRLPEKLNPGPLASRITFFAPVSLLFFFFVVAVLGTAKQRSMHPMNYFFVGCAFFAFHLLFAYLVDHADVWLAFGASSAVSVFLVVTYARHFVGWRFALREIGVSQLVYLVLFSFSFFWEGMTGLSVTIGAILTLHLMMQHTGSIDWGRVLAAKSEAQAPTDASTAAAKPAF
jgi:hypothetical protein